MIRFLLVFCCRLFLHATILIFLMLAMSCQQRDASPEPIAPAIAAGPIVMRVFLYNSVACECEQDRNADAEAAIEQVQRESGKQAVLTRIDTANNEALLDGYQQKARFTVMPVLLGLDTGGRVVKKAEGFLKKEVISEILFSD